MALQRLGLLHRSSGEVDADLLGLRDRLSDLGALCVTSEAYGPASCGPDGRAHCPAGDETDASTDHAAERNAETEREQSERNPTCSPNRAASDDADVGTS